MMAHRGGGAGRLFGTARVTRATAITAIAAITRSFDKT